MKQFSVMFRSVIFLIAAVSVRGTEIDRLPKDFIIGFSTASYQIEGGWNEDGKGLNIFDVETHESPEMFSNYTGDIACDSYHKYKEDVAMLKNLGAQVYRFSISWTRILPNGDTSVINQAGIDYYNNLIDELLLNNIEPIITIYHWDLPVTLAAIGGWTNSTIADYYEDFARIAFENFGDRVKRWITFNEPSIWCLLGYAVLEQESTLLHHNEEYLCGHNILISHARVYHLYDREFRPQQGGFVGITLNSFWSEPETDSEEDREASEVQLQFEFGWFAHPLVIGDYPPAMRERVDASSEAEGLPSSRLPVLDEETIQYMKGAVDFFGLNHYTTRTVHFRSSPSEEKSSYITDGGVIAVQEESWQGASVEWLKVVPWGFRKLLNWIKDTYDNPPVLITENGYADDGELEDTSRINYHREYMREMLKAIHEDDCNVFGYLVWSLMDNFEWFFGYKPRFGVYYVDFQSPERTRIPKASVNFFKEVAETRKIPAES